MFNYNIDIDHIIQQRLRKQKRTPIALALFFAMAKPVKIVYAQFLDSRTAHIKEAKLKGTIVYLERYLNETFDITGITITNQNPESLVYAPSAINDGHPHVYINDVVGSDDVMVGDWDYYNNLPDFVVGIPAAHYASIDQNRLRSILNEYIFSTINYNIISI